MADLNAQIKQALSEDRILILGAEILLGFEYSQAFQSEFPHLPYALQCLKLGSLCLLLITVALLIAPPAYHRIALQGASSRTLLRYLTITMAASLLPFGVAASVDIYVAFRSACSAVVSGAAAGVTCAGALSCWYLLGILARDHRNSNAATPEDRPMVGEFATDVPSDDAPLQQQVDRVLTEARVVLPGLQALLGFALQVTLAKGFDSLPPTSKLVHLGSLGCLTLSMVLLMTTAAYHRIADDGEDRPEFVRLAGTLVIASMVPLALSLSADLYVVADKITHNRPVAVSLAAISLALFLALWFGVACWARSYRRRSVLVSANGSRLR